MDLLGNSLVGPPSRENANAAWAALEKAREIGAKTDRERGWIDAIRAYYRDHDKTDVETRLRAYAHALKKPTILLAEKDKKLPFDLSGFRCLFYENSIGGKRKVEEGLKKHLQAILAD